MTPIKTKPGRDDDNSVVTHTESRTGESRRARLIAFYLPQYHAIAENSAWWGEGFTDWVNVQRAEALFPGHHQPHIPSELGYYDLGSAEVRHRQAGLAREYGIEGFCYWHYWFNGKRLLEMPFQAVLREQSPDFSFCLAWANETWNRRWDGRDSEMLQRQDYGGKDDHLNHIRALLPALGDPRAISVDGKPILLIYLPHRIPRVEEMIEIWRVEAARSGLPGLHLVAIHTHFSVPLPTRRAEVWAYLGIPGAARRAYPRRDFRTTGFDAELTFQPNVMMMRPWLRERVMMRARRQQPMSAGIHGLLEYGRSWRNAHRAEQVWFPDAYPTVFPHWDNSPRRRNVRATIFVGSSPQLYQAWLEEVVDWVQGRPQDKRLIFINAWNEWAEGAHLEPDQQNGRAYLEATWRAVSGKR